jgi:exodeoxyribonuclease-5
MLTPPEINWNHEQLEAIDRIRGWADKSAAGMQISLSGPAGTGKSTLMGAVRPFLDGKPVAWTAMTGKAALRMREAAGVEAKTLHSVLYKRPSKGRNNKLYFNSLKEPDCKFLIIDEASMITPKIYGDLQAWAAQGVRILFVGDGYQLPPVLDYKEVKEHGEDFSIFCKVEGPQLERVMRSGDDIIRVATQLREENQVPKHNVGDAYRICRSATPGMDAINAWMADNDDHILITWRNKLRMAANRLVRKRLGFTGVIPNKSEPVMLCKNGETDSCPVLNGEIHFTEEFREGAHFGKEVKCMNFYTDMGLNIFVNTQGRGEPMDGGLPNIKDWKEYMAHFKISRLPDPIPVTYGYVSTAHKAQGSEYRRVTIFLAAEDLVNDHFRKDTMLPNGKIMSFATRWLYTSLTRSKQKVSLILGS